MKRIFKTRILLIAIIVIAVFFRLFLIDSLPPGLFSDEAMNGNNALTAISNTDFSAKGGPALGWKVFYPENNGREGLFINIQSLFLAGFGNKPWVLRLPSVLFGVFTILGIYFLTKELFKNENMALLASFFTAVSFWHINFSRIGFRAIMAPFFLAWGLYLLLRSFRNSKLSAKGGSASGGEIRNWPLPAIAGLVYGLGMYSYIAYRATPLIILVLLWLIFKEIGWKKTLKNGLLFIITAIIISLPLGLYFLSNPGDFLGRTSQISIFNSPKPIEDLGNNILKTAGMFNFVGDWNPRHNIPGKPLLSWPVGILFLIGVFIAIKNIIQNLKIKNQNDNSKLKINPPRASNEIFHFSFCILISWLVIAALSVVISNEGLPHALRSLLMIPPVFILAAVGGIKLYDWLSLNLNRKLINGVALLFLILLPVETAVNYFIKWGQNEAVAQAFNKKEVEISEVLNKLPESTLKYIVIDTNGFDVRKIGTPAQTIMFLTDTYLPEKQKEKNIYYVSPSQKEKIPPKSFVVSLN